MTTPAQPSRFSLMAFLQPLGRALMLPIAALPIAGLLLRLGQSDMLDIAFLSAAGDAMFANLGLLFAVGVATGFARDGNGAAAMAGVVCFLVATNGAQVFLTVPAATLAGVPAALAAGVTAAWRTAAIDRLEVPIGIVSGLVGGLFYNRFSTLKLPDYLAFFGGRRFVPIIAGVAGLLIALVLGLSYAPINAGMDALSRGVVAAGGFGLFAFGVLNRLLLVTGLHHILNNVAYFVVGDYHGKTGDLTRFFAGDPTAGGFMSGFFPVMMFGLPAACLAMYHTAAPDRRKAVGGMLFSLALTSFLTGVTEPIEFSFMFLAPVLYGVHAVLTGLSEALMNALGVKLGYGFSAGLFDYVLNFGKATRPLLLVPIGAVYAFVYYVLFRWTILRFDLPTPGREAVDAGPAAPAVSGDARAAAFVAALGGSANLRSIDACATRLRLAVADAGAIDEPRLRQLGARGVLRPSPTSVQVVVGGIADGLAMEMRAWADAGHPVEAAPAPAPAAAAVAVPGAMLAALGGAANVTAATRHGGRLRVTVADRARVDEARLASGARGIVWVAPATLHVLTRD
ncbi:N-acetylglucosamine-specific PTS transporter subunit IIBC [Sphingomonas sp. A2-49]|uniref:N-acetylglucosamine-specific PTS transporter subunit IIBC n=1 Tax=Sphingomonas sp. A2-49 TaxID=1391375 RepID=UPI0021D16005|nr:N-acetylglucosamine-specific PTS transporter subunit IIBC [Sphingomonas sp. A2-49]MCU6454324.1 N-acetylglucosamine-specific PTS transporter subunit IIBC [Sphingomonas sp. A2-49]